MLIYIYYKGSDIINDELLSKRSIINDVTLSECGYVLCRKEGVEKAVLFLKKCHEMFIIAPSSKIYPVAAEFKCKYPISLADCWVLATAKIYNASALFLHKEREIEEIFDVISQDVNISFLLRNSV